MFSRPLGIYHLTKNRLHRNKLQTRLLSNTPSPSLSKNNNNAVALIVGAGDGTGQAITRRFVQEGFTVCPVRRNGDKLKQMVREIQESGGEVHPFGVDCRKEDQVIDLVNHIETDVGPIEVVVFNIGANIKSSILETTSRKYFKVWEMACFAGFLVGREAAKRMTKRERGTIIFTGATASVRGGDGFCAFSGAKHALRALAQSMARELGPRGVHVAHVIVDAAIDTPWIREHFPGADEASNMDGLVRPEDIAELYVQILRQPKTAWTFELDVRPWKEKW